MPELPEVETVRRGLEKAIKGAAIQKVTLRRGDLRIPFPPNFAKTLEGKKIIDISRRAKYLLIYMSNHKVLIVHLGMSGRFTLRPSVIPAKAGISVSKRGKIDREIPAFAGMTKKRNSGNDVGKHDHVIITLKDGRVLLYNDARRFGLMTIVDKDALARHPLFNHLGPEPFDKNFSAAYVKKQLARRTMNIKTTLMDQTLVVGVGNIYASEVLFLCGINPARRACDVQDRASDIIKAVRGVLKHAISSGGSSLRDFIDVEGYSGKFQHRFNVYDRAGEQCFTCRAPIKTIRQSGRSTFFCAKCQK